MHDLGLPAALPRTLPGILLIFSQHGFSQHGKEKLRAEIWSGRPADLWLPFAGLVEPQFGDTHEVVIAADQDKIVGKGSRGNPEIVIGDEESVGAEMKAYPCIV